jgi:hypothetical protein
MAEVREQTVRQTDRQTIRQTDNQTGRNVLEIDVTGAFHIFYAHA